MLPDAFGNFRCPEMIVFEHLINRLTGDDAVIADALRRPFAEDDARYTDEGTRD